MYSTLLWTALAVSTVPGQPIAAPAPASDDAVLRWNEVHLQAIRAGQTPPPLAARNLAIMHAAIYDAVNAILRTHQPYRVAASPTRPASPEAAAVAAAHRVLISLYPAQVARFDDALDASLCAIPGGPARQAGVEMGQYVAERLLAWRANDGSRRTVAYAPTPYVGVWRPTPPGYRPPMLPQWGRVVPFAMTSTAQFQPAPPPALNSAAYAVALQEVQSLGRVNSATRSPEQTTIAWFWDDGAGSVTPPGHWNRIAQDTSRRRGLTLADNARLFALLDITLADAAVLCWECKFRFAYWRPVNAIQEADADNNPATSPDPDWMPLLTTPPFPSYTSGHSTFSGAGAAALANFFGTDAVPFAVTSDGVPGVTRSFTRFSAAANEAGRSRIYGGIHYEFDNREGLAAGRALGDWIAASILLPRTEPSAGGMRLIPAYHRKAQGLRPLGLSSPRDAVPGLLR
jgi:hypothetical protein